MKVLHSALEVSHLIMFLAQLEHKVLDNGPGFKGELFIVYGSDYNTFSSDVLNELSGWSHTHGWLRNVQGVVVHLLLVVASCGCGLGLS